MLAFMSVGFSIKLVMLEKKVVISSGYLTMLAFMSVGFSIKLVMLEKKEASGGA